MESAPSWASQLGSPPRTSETAPRWKARAGAQAGEDDGHRAAHAVAEEVERREPEAVHELGQGPGVVLDRVAEGLGPVAEAEAEEVDQEETPPGEVRLARHLRVVARARASEAMDEEERRAPTGQVVVAEQGAVDEAEGVHGAAGR